MMKMMRCILILMFVLQLSAVAQTESEEKTEAKGAENILLPLPEIPSKDATEEEKVAFAKKQREELEKVLGGVYESIDKNTGKKIRDATVVKEQNELLKGIDSFSVVIALNEVALNVISKQELKTKVELNLRRNGIKVDDKLGKALCVFVDVLKLNQGAGYSFRTDLKLMEMCYVADKNGYSQSLLFTWSDGGLGFGSSQIVKEPLITNVIDTVERFSNAYLSQNPNLDDSRPVKDKPTANKSARKK